MDEVENKPLLVADSKTTPVTLSPSVKEYVAYVVNIAITSFALLVTFIVNGLAATGSSKFGFKNSTGNLSDAYHTEVTPAGWTFAIWGVIYAWQVLWLIYGWLFVFRYKTLPTIHWLVYPFYTGSSLCNITWLYLFNNDYPQAAFPILALTAACLYGALIVEAYHLYRYSSSLKESLLGLFDLWAARILVMNGLALYATWVSIATLVNFTVVLEYFADLDSADSGTTSLVILTFEVILYFILDVTILDRFTRYVLIVYAVVVWALSGVYDENEGVGRNHTFVLVLVVAVATAFIVRVLLLIAFVLFRKLPQGSYKKEN